MNFESMNDVVDASPKETLNSILENCDGTGLFKGIDWSIFGQFASSKAYICHIDGNYEGVRDWSELGVEVYRRLKAIERPYENELAEMRVRANAMVFCGSNRSIPLLNPAVVETWFFDLIPYSFEETKLRISKVDNVQSEDFDDLRLLKERLSTIKGLVEREVFENNVELMKWMELREELP